MLFFGFQNSLCRAIQSRFYQVKAFLNRTKETKLLSTQLPKGLHHRLDSLIARDIAALPWQTKTAIAIPPSVTHKIKALHPHLADTTRPLAISIGHVVPRDPQFTSIGDACGIGGGLSAMNCISGLMFCGRLTLEMRSMSEASTSIYSNCPDPIGGRYYSSGGKDSAICCDAAPSKAFNTNRQFAVL